MITTAEYKDVRATLIHRITGEINTEEVKIGIAAFVELLDNAIQKYGTINLIIDAKGVNFTSLPAHRTWSQALDNFPTIKEKINYCAFAIDDSPNGRAEKELMNSERLNFFFDFDEAINWLRDKIGA
jgi:hypothetical protein